MTEHLQNLVKVATTLCPIILYIIYFRIMMRIIRPIYVLKIIIFIRYNCDI